jgi:hypothetical protein
MADIQKIDENRPYKRFKSATVLTTSHKSQSTTISENFSPTNYGDAPKQPRVNEDLLILDGGGY